MHRFSKTTATLAAASLLVFPSLVLRAQPPAPAPATAPAAEKEKAQDKPKDARKSTSSTDPIERIKDEGLNRSKVMETLSHLTNVIGPRLTGSPALKRANEWTRDTMTKWGLENAHLEAWGPFGRGWTLKKYSAQVVEPQCIPLIGYPKAWSPGTDGPVTGEVVYLDTRTDADYAKFKGKLKGAIVLTSGPSDVPSRFEPLALRKTDKQLLDLADAAEPSARGGARRGGPGNAGAPGKAATKGINPGTGADQSGQPPTDADRARLIAEMRTRFEAVGKRARFAAEEGAAVLVDCSTQGDAGTLFVAQASIPGASAFGGGGGGGGAAPARRASVWDKNAPKFPPQLTLGKEHYNRLVRMIQAGETLKATVEIAVEYHDDDLMAYNTIAEIPGTDLRDQVVMIGAHMDSWHSGTGATDNAVGCASAMEALRILKALDLKPRRTIRIGLWSGEEQGLYGSRAYVTKHFGRSPSMGFGAPAAEKKAEPDSDQNRAYENFSAYYNLDNGTGKIRGIYLQGNEALRPLFRRWLVPFHDMGAQTVTVSNTGGTDHQSFDGVGLPGFQFIQDEIDYNTRTHHSNMDVYDRAQADDLKQASVIMAAFLYNTAMMDEKLTRKPATTTPRTPAATSSR